MGCLVGRGINDKFMADLKGGELRLMLGLVLRDDTLCLEIREGYINLYYRGGSMLRISQKQSGYSLAFDPRYCAHKTGESAYAAQILGATTVPEYVHLIPHMKAEMDWYFHEHPKLEREIQQQILRENNRGALAGDTDYYIADMEYTHAANGSRFDMLAVKWPSTAPSRKSSVGLTLCVIEVKCGDHALTGASGIIKHMQDLESFLRNQSLPALCSEVQRMLNQKNELGLISGVKKTTAVTLDTAQKPEYILLFANHKPASAILKRELKAAVQGDVYQSLSNLANIRLAASSLMGYGLYEREMCSIEDYVYADCHLQRS